MMKLEDFQQKYPDFYGFKLDPFLQCITCYTKKPLWFKMSEIKPAYGSIIKAVFVSGFIRYMLVEKGHKLSNLGAYMTVTSPNGIVAWMPAGASLENFVKVRLEAPAGMGLVSATETALHIPVDQEAIFQYRIDMNSFRDTAIADAVPITNLF